MSRSRFACLLLSLLSSGCIATLAVTLAVLVMVVAALSDPPPRHKPLPPSTSTRAAPPPWVPSPSPAPSTHCRPRAECCRVCQRGQACGNTCIGERNNCRQPQGCACNAEELCP